MTALHTDVPRHVVSSGGVRSRFFVSFLFLFVHFSFLVLQVISESAVWTEDLGGKKSIF